MSGTTHYVVQSGTTETITSDVNGQTFDVTGGGTLDITHDANGASISATGVNLIIGHDINGPAEVSLVNSTLTVGHDANGSTFMLNGGTATFTHTINGTSFTLGTGGDEIVLPTNGAQLLDNQVQYFNAGDTIELFDHPGAMVAFNGATYHDTTLTLTENGSPVVTLTDVTSSATTFITGFDSSTGYDYVTPACYAAGTRLRTERGEVAVEDLRVGDLVATAAGIGPALKPVTWIGWRELDLAHCANPEEWRPVRISAGALGEGLPLRDLVVSPDHALLFDGLLVNARNLVNGATIAYDIAARTVRYFHVELARHDVLLAEGVPAESFLDTGNRGAFVNNDGVVVLRPDVGPASMHKDACFPLVESGPALAAIRARLIERVRALGYGTTADADLHLLVNGRVLRPVAAEGGSVRFDLPSGARDVRIVSRLFTPGGVSAESTDMRRLGVCIGGITLTNDSGSVEVALADLGAGCHAIEGDGASEWRWTSGETALPAWTGALGAARLDIRLQFPGSFWTAPEMPLRRSA